MIMGTSLFAIFTSVMVNEEDIYFTPPPPMEVDSSASKKKTEFLICVNICSVSLARASNDNGVFEKYTILRNC